MRQVKALQTRQVKVPQTRQKSPQDEAIENPPDEAIDSRPGGKQRKVTLDSEGDRERKRREIRICKIASWEEPPPVHIFGNNPTEMKNNNLPDSKSNERVPFIKIKRGQTTPMAI